MDIYIYSDESGVLDKVHNKYFIFGGLVFLSKQERDSFTRKYIHAEDAVRKRENAEAGGELKASIISNDSKGKLFRSMNQAEKFGIVVVQEYLKDQLFADKKTKQRYLDWAYKMAVKYKLGKMIEDKKIIPDEVERLHFYVDEHTTATNGIYELRESLENEFKTGSFDSKWMNYHPPLFTKLKGIDLKYCDSKSVPLVRAADIVANRIYHMAIIGDYRGAAGRHMDLNSHPPLHEIVVLDHQ